MACGVPSLALAAISVGCFLFAVYTALSKRASTIEGINGAEGGTDQTSPGFHTSAGPLYLFVGAGQDVACDDVFNSITVTLVPNPSSSKYPFNFTYDEFTEAGSEGQMPLTKDCVVGSQGGYYGQVTAAAVMNYANCKDENCDWDWLAFPPVAFAWDMHYHIVSTHKVSGVARAGISQANDKLFENVWDAAGTPIIAGLVFAALSIVACVMIPAPQSEEGAELMS